MEYYRIVRIVLTVHLPSRSLGDLDLKEPKRFIMCYFAHCVDSVHLPSHLRCNRSLGDLDFKEPKRFVECEPDVRRLVPVPGDNFVVLASDGLWDVLSDQEAVDCANAVLKVGPRVGMYGGL